MSRPAGEELEGMRQDGLSAEVRREFRAAARATAEWERAHPAGLDEILDWIDQLRALFGDPAVDRTPWRGEDFRL
jgi:hypothetical protein